MTTTERIAKYLDRAEEMQRGTIQIQRDTILSISTLHDRMAESEQKSADRHHAIMEEHRQETKRSEARHVSIMDRLNGSIKS